MLPLQSTEALRKLSNVCDRVLNCMEKMHLLRVLNYHRLLVRRTLVVDLFTLFNSETNSFCTHSFVTVLSSRYTVKTSANLLLETVAWTVTQIQVTLDHAFSTLYAFHEWNEERRKFINIQFVKCIKKWRWTWRNACRKIFFMSLKFKWRESSSKSWNLHAAKSKMLRVLLY